MNTPKNINWKTCIYNKYFFPRQKVIIFLLSEIQAKKLGANLHWQILINI